MMAKLNVTIFSELSVADTLFLTDANTTTPPFPFNLPYHYRVTIAIMMAINFAAGAYLRLIIMKYLRESGTKMGPINLLIWMDQLNGIFLALNIAGRIVAFLIPFPLSLLTGDKFCTWSPLPGNVLKVLAHVESFSET